MVKIRDLQAVKDRFVGFSFIDLTGYDLPTAHWHLGVHVRQQVQKILNLRLEELDKDNCSFLMNQSRACAETLTDKLTDQRINSLLREAIQEYVDCLAAWAEGAGLRGYDHPALAACKPLCPLDLAFFLQHDSTGCQTGMYRQPDGSVIFWHTEEDIEVEAGNGFDQLRLAAFNVGTRDHPVSMHAFIYPDLLPGPAFGWRSDGYTQAVDTLHTRRFPEMKAGMLANILTWLTLRLGPACDPSSVIREMGPFFDGYALNVLSVRDGKVRGEKYEFAADKVFSSTLDEQPGSYQFQVNIFSQKEHPWVKQLEKIAAVDHRLYEKRAGRTHAAMLNKDHRVSPDGDMKFFFDLLTSRIGNVWAYSNIHVKAYAILHQGAQGGELWLGHGPALPTDQASVIFEIYGHL